MEIESLGQQSPHTRELHWFPCELVLDVGDSTSGIKERATGEDRDALLRCVQHLLDTGHHARDIGRDERILGES